MPDNRVDILFTTNPDATGPALADVAETDVGLEVWDQLANVSQPAGTLVKEDSDITECFQDDGTVGEVVDSPVLVGYLFDLLCM